MAQQEFEEKRDFMRMLVDCEVRCNSPAHGRSYKGRVQNLSAHGLMFSSTLALTMGEQLEFVIDSPGGAVPPLEASGEVVRVTTLEEGRLYEIGVAFRQVR